MRRALLGLLGLAALLTGAVLLLRAALEAGRFTPRIEAALGQALGRPVALGRITLQLGLPLRIGIADATIADPSGSSRAGFARIDRIDLGIEPWALLQGRLAITQARLVGVELLLEPSALARGGGTAPRRFGIDGLRVEDSRIAFTDPALPPIVIHTAELRGLAGVEPSLAARLTWRDEALALTARAGGTIAARIDGEGFHLAAAGPATALALTGEVASASRLAALLQAGGAWPVTGPIAGAATLVAGDGAALEDITVGTGPVSLLGVALGSLRLEAAGLDAPTTLRMATARGGMALAARLPSPRRLLAEPQIPIEARITSGAAALAVTTRMGRDGAMAAAELHLTAPSLAALDLTALGPAFALDLPALNAVDARLRIPDPQARPLRLERIRLRATEVEASGDLTLTPGPRPAWHGTVQVARLDLDALSPPGAASPPGGRVIPDIALPVGMLRGFDATLDLTATRIAAGGVEWRALRTRAALAQGRLALDPLAFELPGGGFAGRLSLAAAASPPHLAVALSSTGRGFNPAPLRRARGLGVWLDGPAEIAFDLQGRGASLRAIAATLGGEFGVAMIEGRMPQAGLLQVGPNLTQMLLPRGPPAEGIEIRCLALRLTAEAGLAQSQALLVEGPAGRVAGRLALNLRDETLAAHLLPDIRMLGFNMRAPVTLGGSFAAPRFDVEPGQALARVMADTVTNRLWRSSTVEWLRGGDGGDCATALRLARLGRVGAVPEAAPAMIPIVPRELQGPVQDVLRGLGGLLGGTRR